MPPMLAAVAMAASSISVVTSSLFLRLYKPGVDIEAAQLKHGMGKPLTKGIKRQNSVISTASMSSNTEVELASGSHRDLITVSPFF